MMRKSIAMILAAVMMCCLLIAPAAALPAAGGELNSGDVGPNVNVTTNEKYALCAGERTELTISNDDIYTAFKDYIDFRSITSDSTATIVWNTTDTGASLHHLNYPESGEGQFPNGTLLATLEFRYNSGGDTSQLFITVAADLTEYTSYYISSDSVYTAGSWETRDGQLVYVEGTLDVTNHVIGFYPIKSLEITSDPDDMNYTAGEKLNLDGMKVTLKYKDDLYRIITPDEFDAYGVDTSTNSGTVLSLDDNGKKLTVTCAVPGIDAVQSSGALTVSAEAPDTGDGVTAGLLAGLGITAAVCLISGTLLLKKKRANA